MFARNHAMRMLHWPARRYCTTTRQQKYYVGSEDGIEMCKRVYIGSSITTSRPPTCCQVSYYIMTIGDTWETRVVPPPKPKKLKSTKRAGDGNDDPTTNKKNPRHSTKEDDTNTKNDCCPCYGCDCDLGECCCCEGGGCCVVS